LFGFVTKHARDSQMDGQTAGQTDRQNYDSKDRASIASRGKNEFETLYNTFHIVNLRIL